MSVDKVQKAFRCLNIQNDCIIDSLFETFVTLAFGQAPARCQSFYMKQYFVYALGTWHKSAIGTFCISLLRIEIFSSCNAPASSSYMSNAPFKTMLVTSLKVMFLFLKEKKNAYFSLTVENAQNACLKSQHIVGHM